MKIFFNGKECKFKEDHDLRGDYFWIKVLKGSFEYDEWQQIAIIKEENS